MMTIEQIEAMPGTYYVLPKGTWAVFFDDGSEDFLVAKYSHSEETTPFNRHWTKSKNYFKNVHQLEEVVNIANLITSLTKEL
jgi:hypothetical protein